MDQLKTRCCVRATASKLHRWIWQQDQVQAKAAAVEIQFTPLQKLSFPIHFLKPAQVCQHATTVLYSHN